MKNRQISLIFFLIIQLYIYTMLICYNNLISTNILAFSSTLLCFLITLFMHCKTKDYFIMITAFSLTLISDILFIFFNNLQIVSLIFLNLIQLLYFLRTYLDSEYKKSNILTRFIALPISIIFCTILLKEKLDINAILWTIYTVNLFINILFTIKDIGINNFFPIGLIFLFIHSSLMMFMSLEHYVSTSVQFIEILKELPFDIKHAVYLPAQTILACSVFTVNRLQFSKIKKEDN